MKAWLIVGLLVTLFLIAARIDNPKDYEDSELTEVNKQAILAEWRELNVSH